VIQAICFDAFGTLVEITDKRRPFRALLRRNVQSITAEDVLTRPLNLREVAASVSHELGEGGLTELERDLQAECASVRLRPGIAAIWQSLRDSGLRIGVCSNLALPYGPPLLSALPDTPDAVILSYEVGLVKPDPAIFHLVCDRLSFLPAEILFVGDTPSADIEGPRAIGMPAMLISDFEEYTRREAHRIGELPEDLLAAIQGAEYGSGTLHTPSSDAGRHIIDRMACPAKRSLSWKVKVPAATPNPHRLIRPALSGGMMNGQGQQSAFVRPVPAKWRINPGADGPYERWGVTTPEAAVPRADEPDDVRMSKG